MFHDFSMTIFIFQVLQSPWNPARSRTQDPLMHVYSFFWLNVHSGAPCRTVSQRQDKQKKVLLSDINGAQDGKVGGKRTYVTSRVEIENC